MGLGFLVGIVGGFLLAHAAFSTIQFTCADVLGGSVIMQIEGAADNAGAVHWTSLQLIELLVGLGLCLWAGVAVPTKFLSIVPDSDENRVVSLPDNLDFMIFNHRGKVLPSNPDLKLKI